MTSLAGTYVQDGEPEEACRIARLALNGASRMQLEPVLKIVLGLRRDLAPYCDTVAVRELDEHLRTGTAATAAG